MKGMGGIVWLLALAAVLYPWGAAGGEATRIASYNLRNYLVMDRLVEGAYRPEYPKPEREKRVVRETIRAADPDILLLQEVGGLAYLLELREDLEAEGLSYAGMAIVSDADPERQLAALWKPGLAVEARTHPHIPFAYFGETTSVRRGMLQLTVSDAAGDPVFRLFNLHLKSKYTDDQRDPQSLERRTREARAIRDVILAIDARDGALPYLICGDLNDGPQSRPLRALLQIGDRALGEPVECLDDSGLEWTHYYKNGGTYARIDYVLASGLFSERFRVSGSLFARRDFYQGSDHRMLVFSIEPRGED